MGYRVWMTGFNIPPKGTKSTIAKVEAIEVYDRRKQEEITQLSLHFSNTKKVLVLNNTQFNVLTAIAGDDPQGWVGAVVFLKPRYLTKDGSKRTVDISEATATAKGKTAPPAEAPDDQA
jgi:hypothetical protein